MHCTCVKVVEGHVKELSDAIHVTDVTSLQLDEKAKIGYTFKALGAGFWALKQTSFRHAIETITMEVKDARILYTSLVAYHLIFTL